jgi:GNAT superfamily N-acetyltransferase
MKTHHALSCAGPRTTTLVHEPWKLRVNGCELTVRASTEHDLASTAIMHRRCSARSLLGRYRLGGRPPAVLALDRQLRAPLSFVVSAGGPDPSAVIATASLTNDAQHGPSSLQIGVLVEDSWQRQGVGRELVRHLAGVAVLVGFNDLVAYPGPSATVAQGLLVRVGTTRLVEAPEGNHLHAAIPMRAVEGLGPVRTGRFVWGMYDEGMGAIA